MIPNHCLSITHHDAQTLAHHNLPWFTATGSAVNYAEPVVVNHGVLNWANGCESCCVMLSQWLWIMVCYAEPVAVNHGELWWASVWASWCVILRQWLGNMVYYAGPVAMYHGVLCWASGCESWCVILSQWLWIMVSYDEPVVVNDSQSLAQHNTPWFTTADSA
jgi:hypothetical protein